MSPFIECALKPSPNEVHRTMSCLFHVKQLMLSRSMARVLLAKGKFGVFDPYHNNKGIELTAGLRCAEVRKALVPVQSAATSVPSPARRGRGSQGRGSGSGGDEKETETENESEKAAARRSSHSSLESLGSGARGTSPASASAAPPPRFFSTRAAIPLMQDAFVCKCGQYLANTLRPLYSAFLCVVATSDFEYFIKSASPGSLSSGGSGSAHGLQGEGGTSNRPPVVSLGLASCDFSLDSMVSQMWNKTRQDKMSDAAPRIFASGSVKWHYVSLM